MATLCLGSTSCRKRPWCVRVVAGLEGVTLGCSLDSLGILSGMGFMKIMGCLGSLCSLRVLSSLRSLESPCSLGRPENLCNLGSLESLCSLGSLGRQPGGRGTRGPKCA